MKEERMKVLEMLQEGKITADEAANLLRQFPEKKQSYEGTQYPPDAAPQSSEGGFFSWIKDNILTPGGPKENIDFQSAPVGNGIVSLRLSGKNDSLQIESYRGDCVKLHCQYVLKKDSPQFVMYEENGHIELLYNADAIKSLKILCKLPMVPVDEIRAKSTNGRVKLEGIKAGKLDINTGNGSISLENVQLGQLDGRTSNASIKLEKVSAERISLETGNGKIKLENVQADFAGLETSNGGIKVEYSDITEITAATSNGAVKFEGLDKTGSWSAERSVEASTSNGSITFELPRDIGLKLEAATTNSQITCDLNDTISGEVSRHHISGKNQNYDSGGKRLALKLGTTNGAIRIKEV